MANQDGERLTFKPEDLAKGTTAAVLAKKYGVAEQLDRDNSGFANIRLCRAALDLATHVVHGDAALPDRILHILALIQRDATVSDDHFVIRVGHVSMLGACGQQK